MKALERVKGIEPSYSAWEAAALPLSYTRAGLARGQSLRRTPGSPYGGIAGLHQAPFAPLSYLRRSQAQQAHAIAAERAIDPPKNPPINPIA